MGDKHEHRAHKVLDVLAPAVKASGQDRFVSENCGYLAEQFREVEREAQQPGVYVPIGEVQAKLREVVRAGDALLVQAKTEDDELVLGDLDKAIKAWDAATKDISRD